MEIPTNGRNEWAAGAVRQSMDVAMRRKAWLAGGVVVFAWAMAIGWPPADPLGFLGPLPKESLGGGMLPVGPGPTPISGARTTSPMSEVVNVRADYEEVLRTAQKAGYRITRDWHFSVAERGAGEPRLHIIAGVAKVVDGSRFSPGDPAHRTVVGVENRAGWAHLAMRQLGFALRPENRGLACAYDPRYAHR